MKAIGIGVITIFLLLTGCAMIQPTNKKAVDVKRVQTTVTPQSGVSSILDTHDGNGVDILASAETITAKIDFSKADPSTGGRIKISYPAPQEGFYLAEGGEVLIGRLGYPGNDDIVSSFTVPDGGKGPVVMEFRNPSTESNPMDMVATISLNGDKRHWLCIPWEPQKLYFAKADAREPGGAKHVIAFRAAGAELSDVVEMARSEGWIPAAEYHKDEMQGEPWKLKNLMTGEAP